MKKYFYRRTIWNQTLLSLLNQPEVMALPIDDIIALTNYSRGYAFAPACGSDAELFLKVTGKTVLRIVSELCGDPRYRGLWRTTL